MLSNQKELTFITCCIHVTNVMGNKKEKKHLFTSTCMFLLTDNRGRRPLFLFYLLYSVLYCMTGCHLSLFFFILFFSFSSHFFVLNCSSPFTSLYPFPLTFFFFFLLPCITCCLCGHWMAADWFLCAAGDQSALYFPPHKAPGCHSRRPWHVLVPPPTKACTHRYCLYCWVKCIFWTMCIGCFYYYTVLSHSCQTFYSMLLT